MAGEAQMQSSHEQSVEYAAEFATVHLDNTEWKAAHHHLMAAALGTLTVSHNTPVVAGQAIAEVQAVPASYAAAYLDALD
jgi:hypothetical protein